MASASGFSSIDLFLDLQPWLETLPPPEDLQLPESLLGLPVTPQGLQIFVGQEYLIEFGCVCLCLCLCLCMCLCLCLCLCWASVYVIVSVSVSVSVLVSVSVFCDCVCVCACVCACVCVCACG
jgi:hypothetical protein